MKIDFTSLGMQTLTKIGLPIQAPLEYTPLPNISLQNALKAQGLHSAFYCISYIVSESNTQFVMHNKKLNIGKARLKLEHAYHVLANAIFCNGSIHISWVD